MNTCANCVYRQTPICKKLHSCELKHPTCRDFKPNNAHKICDELLNCSNKDWEEICNNKISQVHKEFQNCIEQGKNLLDKINRLDNKKHEIPYLYIGLLREIVIHEQNRKLVELGQDAINYRRVEMCPCDWEFFEKATFGDNNLPLKLFSNNPNDFNAMTNGVNVKFPEMGSAWGDISHFGVYDSMQINDKKADNLLCVGDVYNRQWLDETVIGENVEFSVGRLDIPLKH